MDCGAQVNEIGVQDGRVAAVEKPRSCIQVLECPVRYCMAKGWNRSERGDSHSNQSAHDHIRGVMTA